MATLISFAELATWTQNDPADVAADPFAAEVLDKVSGLVRFLTGHPEYEPSNAPFDVTMVALQVAKRTYANPDQEVATGVGPISSRVLDAAAMLTELTESERRTLTKYNPAGDPDNPPVGGLWVQPTKRHDYEALKPVTLYVDDDQQINLGDERPWSIPMFSPGDPGDPNNSA